MDLNQLYQKLIRVDPRLANLTLTSADRSWCEEKQIIHLKDTGDDNSTMYVALHLSAMALNTTYGHNEEFLKIFRQLLDRARELQLYQGPNLLHLPADYYT
jgi:hypothetical protein